MFFTLVFCYNMAPTGEKKKRANFAAPKRYAMVEEKKVRQK